MTRKVLIAVDNDSCTQEIIKLITETEWAPQTHFLVLHIIEPVFGADNVMPKALAETIRADSIKDGTKFVRDVAIRIRDTFKTPYVEERVCEGYAKEAIGSIANDWEPIK